MKGCIRPRPRNDTYGKKDFARPLRHFGDVRGVVVCAPQAPLAGAFPPRRDTHRVQVFGILAAHRHAVQVGERDELVVIACQAGRVAISSTKPVTGHLLGAAGAIETVVCALAIQHGEIPPTINLTKPAEGCDLDYVPCKSRRYPVRVAMNVNSGFGGKNSCLILRAYRAEE